MPKIETFTARGGSGVMPANQVSPDSFGAQAFQGITQLGRGFAEVGQKIQHNQDQLDLLKLSSQYEIQLDQAKAEIANHPDLERHGEMLQDVNDKIQDKLLKANPSVSSAVQTAFANHAIKQYTSAAVDLAHKGREIAVQRQTVDLTNRAQALVDTQAMIAPGEAFGRDTSHRPGQVRGTVDHLIQSFTTNGTLHPAAAEKLRDDLNHRYWEQRATEFPEHVMQVVGTGKLGPDDFNMDQAKAQHYNAVAVNTLNQRQAARDKFDKDQEKQVKATQDANAVQIQADLMEGKPSTPIAPLLRQRGLDSKDAQRLYDFQITRTQTPNIMNYNQQTASATEAYLSVHKFDNKPIDRDAWRTITDDYNVGRISEPEHTRLMALYRDVENHKQQKDKDGGNAQVGHANANLKHELRTSGPADKYDALSEQTIVNADRTYWQMMIQNPNADPWETAKKVSAIYKPVIEKRLALGKEDKAKLDDARITGMVHTKTLSHAAAKALRDEKQDDEGKRIVQEALKNLPPPPPPGYFERFQNFLKKPEAQAAKPRKTPGVMGE